MATESNGIRFRRGPRLRLNPRCDVSVTLYPTSNPQNVVRGHLADISVSGAKAAVDGAVGFNERVVIRIECPDAGVDLSLYGWVSWISPGEANGGWIVGCTFEPELAGETMEEFFMKGLFNRSE